jgi:acetoin:2,6-dichlorophenolindophenol oxidoreductase subunit alpha
MEMEMETKLDFYRTMYTIRRFEEKAIELYQRDLIRASIHVYIGQEAIAAGSCAALRIDDALVSHHRGHGHCIAKGADLTRMFAELLGRENGLCKGKGGSMHIADVSKGILGANGIVGGGMSIATGIALGFIYKGTDQVSVCYFGDGAINQGVLYESFNLAVIWDLPIIFICENNQYALSSDINQMLGGPGIVARAQAFGVHGEQLEGNQVEEVFKAMKGAVERARSGQGPSLIEAITYRWFGHFYGDPCVYRTKEEVEDWKTRCPVATYRQVLLDGDSGLAAALDKIDIEVSEDVNKSAEIALNSNMPDPAAVMEDIYVP